MYPDFKNYDEYNHYVLSYASNQDVADLEKKIDDLQKDEGSTGADIPLVDGKIPAEYLPSNTVATGEDGKIPADVLPSTVVTVGEDGTIPSSMLPSYVDDVIDVDTLPETGEAGKIYITSDNKQYRWSGSQFVEITSGGVVIGDVTGTAYDGGKGKALETKVTNLEATVSDKLGVNDVAVWAKSEDPTLIPSNKLDDHAVKYSDFSYVPGGETEPVARKTIQLANYDSVSGLNTEGNDAVNLIMMSKWNKVDIGSSRYPVNLNGSEFTLNDKKTIATVDQIPTDVVTHEELADKLGVDDVSNWAKAQDPTLIPSSKLDDHAVKYSDFSYVPGGESDPVERKTIQLNNYDSISGMNVEGTDAANLIMMSKWNKVDIGSSRYPVNLNGSEFTLNDEKVIATTDQIPSVFETKGLTDLETGASNESIETALGTDFASLVEIIRENKTIIVDRNSAGDYKACIHATGNISSGNGGANLMFFVGTVPTIYEIQYVNNTFALYVATYEFAKKADIPDTSSLVPATRTVAGKSLESDVVLYAADIKEKDGSANTVYDLIPKVISCPMDSRVVKDSYTVAEILAMFGGSTTMTEARVFANRGINYFDTSNNIGSYQKYTIPVSYYNIPNGEPTMGTITLIGVGPDPHNKDLITKFTITMNLNGDASTITIDTKALES